MYKLTSGRFKWIETTNLIGKSTVLDLVVGFEKKQLRADPDFPTCLGVKSKRDTATHYDSMVIHRETVYMLVVFLPLNCVLFLECFNV